jgi:hypothetical protein
MTGTETAGLWFSNSSLHQTSEVDDTLCSSATEPDPVPVVSHPHPIQTAPAIPRHERFSHNLLGRLRRLQAMQAPTVEEIEEKLFLEEHLKQREAKAKAV